VGGEIEEGTAAAETGRRGGEGSARGLGGEEDRDVSMPTDAAIPQALSPQPPDMPAN